MRMAAEPEKETGEYESFSVKTEKGIPSGSPVIYTNHRRPLLWQEEKRNPSIKAGTGTWLEGERFSGNVSETDLQS